jgi:hypothetical protein
MQKNVLWSVLVIAALGAGIFLIAKYLPNKTAEQNTDTNAEIIPDVSTDILWNAYTVNGKSGGTVFIYPSDWTFVETTDGNAATPALTGKANGFSVSYPISSNSFDRVDVGGACPDMMIPEIHSVCINSIWMHTQSENPKVLSVFNDMKTFVETGARPN